MARPASWQRLLLAWILLSGSLAAVLWQQRWTVLQQRQARQSQTDLGLLELRINSHKITALDWGHWDPLYAFAGGQDPGFVGRELEPSSIIRDGQLLLLRNRDGRELLKGGTVSPGLRNCLNARLAELRQRSNRASSDQAFGFHCQAGDEAVLGAGTGIRASTGQGAERGWLLHFSRLQRPSYNEAVNAGFQRINALIHHQQSDGDRAAAAISELSAAGQQLRLQPDLSPWPMRLQALREMAPSWIGINALLAAAATGALLSLRQWRQLRLLRRELPGPLLSRGELLETLEQSPQLQSELWIAALLVKVTLFNGALQQRSSARTQALAWLGERLQQQACTRHLALGEDNTLLQILQANPSGAQAAQQQIELELRELKRAMADAMELAVSGIMAPLDPHNLQQQLSDLALLLSQPSSQGSVQLLPDGVASAAAAVRQQLGRDFDLSRRIASLNNHRYALEPVLELRNGDQRLAYSELLFRLPRDLEGSITVQELVLALERNNNVHLLDQLMLRRAIALLRDDPDRPGIGVNISALSFAQEQHLQQLLAQLRPLPESLRRRLVLEVTETALLQHPEQWGERLDQLRQVGVQISIDDFGVGFASVSYLFQFQPDYLKLDLSYSQRLGDANVDALVAFLLRYGGLNGCGLILEGIETSEQLTYWQERGVSLFQGYLFHTPQAS
ncbi:MAG: hypothetical protein RLZZ631_1908 [Cyanobacteriota bacterium]